VRSAEDLQRYWDWSTQNSSDYQSATPYRKGLGVEKVLNDGTVIRTGPSEGWGTTIDITTSDGQTIKLHVNAQTGGEIKFREAAIEPKVVEPKVPEPTFRPGGSGLAGAPQLDDIPGAQHGHPHVLGDMPSQHDLQEPP
jgi:hypothetical protein